MKWCVKWLESFPVFNQNRIKTQKILKKLSTYSKMYDFCTNSFIFRLLLSIRKQKPV